MVQSKSITVKLVILKLELLIYTLIAHYVMVIHFNL